MKIRKAAPFEGKPVFHLPTRYGICTGKETLLRIAVTGERPIGVTVSGLPDGLTLSGNTVRGSTAVEGDHPVTVRAENALGAAEHKMTLCVHEDTVLLTPLMGFCSWNAFRSTVSQEKIEHTAKTMVESGLADYGYCYVNIDSGWQKEYGGEFDAVMPNDKFPDMGALCAYIHGLGLKCGIYSTPMLTAWGCPAEFKSVPGCTRGEPDILFACTNGGIGKEHLELNNVRQWEKWGFDYLKYDWIPSEPINAELMKKALRQSGREMAYCVTFLADRTYREYWKRNVNAWRDNYDSTDSWEGFHGLRRYLEPKGLTSIEDWRGVVSPGHFYDLDMLEIGPMFSNNGKTGLTPNETVFAYTLRAFFLSPIQLSCVLEEIGELERDVFCNEDMIRIHQDSLADYPVLVSRANGLHIFARALENGDTAYAVFNTEDRAQKFELGVRGERFRELWTGKTGVILHKLADEIEAHCALVYRVSAE